VLVVPVISAAVVVPCGGLMLRSVRHGRGEDGAFVGFSRIFLLGILTFIKGSLRDAFISRSALKG
jgi:hypothetical protein